MKRAYCLFIVLLIFCPFLYGQKVGLTLIPPTTITDRVDLDIRAGIVNNEAEEQRMDVSIYLNRKNDSGLIHRSEVTLPAGESYLVKEIVPTGDMVGRNRVFLVVDNGDERFEATKEIEVIHSDIRSTQTIDGTWAGFYHWSETEGKHWNPDLKTMSDADWGELVRSMHKLGMDIIVLTEVFRNQLYVGQHDQTLENYAGQAFYPSEIYSERFPIAAENPVEAVLSEADRLGMNVFVGVGMFAWFDFTDESLEWHKNIVDEVWRMYGHHPSFYGFYVSEESHGALDNWEKDDAMKLQRRGEIVRFFDEFKAHCSQLAPDKPVMLATNSSEVPLAVDTYPALLENLDIICPFGFARLNDTPNELGGKQTAELLQELCDDAGSHLWFDLEVFRFDSDKALVPRTTDEIIGDLRLFDNFEKILCYQMPGIFGDPDMSFRIGQELSLIRFAEYRKYLKYKKKERRR